MKQEDGAGSVCAALRDLSKKGIAAPGAQLSARDGSHTPGPGVQLLLKTAAS